MIVKTKNVFKKIKKITFEFASSRHFNRLLAVCLQEVLRFKSLVNIIFIPTIVTLSLYSVIFVDVLGVRIHEMGGMSYKEFVIPGLIIMTVISNVFGHVTGSLYSSKRQAYISEQLVTGMPEWIFIFGFLFGGILRGITVGFVGFVVIFFLIGYKPSSITYCVLLIILTSVLFSLFGIIAGLLAKKIETLSAFSMYVIIPCTMFGGVYYSPDMLTGIWYRLTVVDPIYHIVNAFRQVCSGDYLLNMSGSLLTVVAIIIGLAVFARILIHRVSYAAE